MRPVFLTNTELTSTSFTELMPELNFHLPQNFRKTDFWYNTEFLFWFRVIPNACANPKGCEQKCWYSFKKMMISLWLDHIISQREDWERLVMIDSRNTFACTYLLTTSSNIFFEGPLRHYVFSGNVSKSNKLVWLGIYFSFWLWLLYFITRNSIQPSLSIYPTAWWLW